MLKKCSLRMRLTLLTTLIITAVCVVLTLVSIQVARRTFVAERLTLPLTPYTSSNAEPAEATVPALPFTEPQSIDAAQITNALLIPKQQFASSNILYMLVIILLGSIATYFVAGRALLPVKKLSEAVEAINQNNLNLCLDGFLGHDEISSLASTFNRMTGRLEQAFEQQKSFAANAAHELKTPLASLRANIEVFRMEENPSVEDCKEIVEITQRNTERLITLVDDLLAVSSNQEYEVQKCPLQPLLDAVINDLTPLAAQRGITLTVTDCVHTLEGNPALLERLFYNLILNAIKYNRSNGQVSVDAVQSEDFCVVSVADTGMGIPPEQREAIFEPFYRIDKSRSRKVGGSGLGLAICRMIALQHHATISVHANKPYGSVFAVAIPLPGKAD